MSRILHHANLLIGEREEAEVSLREFCNKLGIELKNNPDFFAFRNEVFGIEEARRLRLQASQKALTGKKIFFISPLRLTLEAQNALLKTFEDPTPDTFFFLVTREEALILPTLRSRMETVSVSKNLPSELTDAEEFLSLSLRSRLSFVKKFIEKEKSLPVFLDNLLGLVRKKDHTGVLVEKVYNVRRFASDTAVLPRLILEHLSLVLP
jgi:hypothetical protein